MHTGVQSHYPETMGITRRPSPRENVLPPPPVLHDPSFLGKPPGEASPGVQRGWLTDQLRGKRVWCSISLNNLYICEGTNLTVVRQTILLPGCTVRHLELKPVDQHRKAPNGITRHFMSKSASRLGQFHFILENPVSGQQFLFGAETQYEFDQWRVVLGKICQLRADSDVANGRQIRDFSQWINQLKRACSEPQISTGVGQDGFPDHCTAFAKRQFVKGGIFSVQSDYQQTELVQSDHENTELVQFDDAETDLVQYGAEKTFEPQSANEKKHLVRSDNEKTDLVQSDHRKTELVQSDHRKTELVQSDHRKTQLVQRDYEKTQLSQCDQEKADLVQSDNVKIDLVESDDEKTDFGQSDHKKTYFIQSVQGELDSVQFGQKKANTIDRVRKHGNPANSHITSLPIKAKHDINHNLNTEATLSNTQSKTRESRSVVRFKPSLGAVFRRLTRSASTGSKTQVRSLSRSQQDGNIANLSATTDGDSSARYLEVHKKQFFATRPGPLEASPDKCSYSKSHSFSLPRLAAKIFGDSPFYKDSISKSAGTSLKDVKDVVLSGHLMCRTGSMLRRVYCVLSGGFLYMFASTRPEAVSERVIALYECAVTYVSEMHERSKNLFTFKLCLPGRDGISLSADSQQTMLRWMTVIQSVSVGVQSAKDIISELTENKQDIDMRSTPGTCLHGGQNADSDTWQPPGHLHAPGTRQPPEHMHAPGTAKDIHGHVIVENADMPEPSEGYDLLSMTQGLATSNTYPTKNTIQQSESPVISRQLMISSRPNVVSGCFNSRNTSQNCDQQESSRHGDMPRSFTSRDTAEKRVGNFQSNNFTCVENQLPFEQRFNSSTHRTTLSHSASTKTPKGLKETNAQIVEMVKTNDCSSPVQDVSSTEWTRQSSLPTERAKQTSLPCSDLRELSFDVALTDYTNHYTGFESRDEINHSLLNESKADGMQPNQTFVHNDNMKQAGKTTGPSFLEDVKKTIHQRNHERTFPAAGHDVCIVEDDWNLADTHGVTLLKLTQTKLDSECKGLPKVCDSGDVVRNTTDSGIQLMDSSHLSQAPDISDGTVRQTTTDIGTRLQTTGSVRQGKSLASVRQQLVAEVARQTLQLKAMQAVRDGAKGEHKVSPGLGFLPPDVDKVCLLTKLLQRKMSTQIQIEALHRQIEAFRDRTKERSVFQIGKKRTDTLQGNTEMNSERSELEEQIKVLSTQLQELDQFLEAYSTPSPVLHPKGRNSRLRHSYDQALLRNIRLNAESRDNSSSSRGRNQETLKNKVSQLYRSLSLKSSVQKLAQKTFSKANWYRNKGSSQEIEEKVRVIKSSSARTNSVSRVANVDTNKSGSGVSDTCDGPANAMPANTLAHSEKEFASNIPLGRFQDESTLDKKTVLAKTPSVVHLAGNIQVSSSLKRVDMCPMKIQVSRSLTHLDKCAADLEMSPSLTHLERYKGALQILPASTPLERRARKMQQSSSSSLLSKLSFKRENALHKDLCGTSVSSSQMAAVSQATAVTSRHMEAVLPDTVALSASPGAVDSAAKDDCQEITTPRSRRSRSQENVVTESPRFSGQEKIVTEPNKRQVSAGALAEIQAFETLLVKCLGPDSNNK